MFEVVAIPERGFGNEFCGVLWHPTLFPGVQGRIHWTMKIEDDVRVKFIHGTREDWYEMATDNGPLFTKMIIETVALKYDWAFKSKESEKK